MQSNDTIENSHPSNGVKIELDSLNSSNELTNGTHKTNENTSTLTWHNINVHVPTSKSNIFAKMTHKETGATRKKKHIIKNMDGIAKPYEVLAIMGSSGAGKSTLLNVLNSRNIDQLEINGDIKINGKSLKSIADISSISGYVQQNDLFIGTLKVKEHLFFQAMLRMDKSTSKEERVKRVDSVLDNFNLSKCQDCLIGSPERDIKGISGGEMRRLSFASEIITNPSILFCDEPTSGLDSFMAMSIVESMKNLAKTGKTIICTIHQPSSEIFEMFDKICFISEGRLAFLGSQINATNFFDRIGFKCPQNHNPADYYIKLLSIHPNDRANSLKRLDSITDGFERSKNYTRLNSQLSFIDSQTGLQKAFVTSLKSKPVSIYKTNILVQMKWLLWRNGLAVLRDSGITASVLLRSIIISLIFGMIFFDSQLDQEGIQNINSLIFLATIYIGISTVFQVINTFPLELQIFRREHQCGMYSVFSYYTTKSLIELPVHVLSPIFFASIYYWMGGLNPSLYRFFICCVILILTANVSVSFGHFVSALSPTTSVASTVASPVMGLMMLFSGCFLNDASIPKYFMWIKYLSWIGYSSQSLVLNQWKNVTDIKCEGFARCFSTGDDILDSLNFNPDLFHYNIAMLVYLIFGWRLLAYISLVFQSYKR